MGLLNCPVHLTFGGLKHTHHDLRKQGEPEGGGDHLRTARGLHHPCTSLITCPKHGLGTREWAHLSAVSLVLGGSMVYDLVHPCARERHACLLVCLPKDHKGGQCTSFTCNPALDTSILLVPMPR